MWQVLNPNSYVTPELNPSGTFVEPANSIDDGNTREPLLSPLS
jgi:hypothetical protein